MPSFLVDKSALARHQTRPQVRQVLDPLLLSREVATCGVVDLEVLYSADSRRTYRATSAYQRGLPRASFDEECVRRALEVQAALAERSQHRAVSLPDLLVAACAERHDLTVLHYDADFDRISKVTGQPTRWVVPRGSVS
jgi:predicted nucleic acid-binding protein